MIAVLSAAIMLLGVVPGTVCDGDVPSPVSETIAHPSEKTLLDLKPGMGEPSAENPLSQINRQDLLFYQSA